MRAHVTVVPVDRVVIVDGDALWFDFTAPDTLHALQWHEGAGHREFTDGRPNAPLAPDDYQERVAPFVTAWEAEKARLEEEGGGPPESPAVERIIAGCESRIQARLDDFARTGVDGRPMYDSMLSACTYAASGVAMYRLEGRYCVDARDATWARAYELLESLLPAFLAGGHIPAWETIEAQLPPLAWPEGSRGHTANTEE